MKIYLASCGDDSGGFSMYKKGQMRAMLFSFYDLTDSWAPFRKRAFNHIIKEAKHEAKKGKATRHLRRRQTGTC